MPSPACALICMCPDLHVPCLACAPAFHVLCLACALSCMCSVLDVPCPSIYKAVLSAHHAANHPKSLEAASTEKRAQPAASVVCSSKSSSASVWFSLTSPLGAPLLLAAWYSLPSLSFSKLLRTMMDSRITSTVLSRTYSIHSFIHSLNYLFVSFIHSFDACLPLGSAVGWFCLQSPACRYLCRQTLLGVTKGEVTPVRDADIPPSGQSCFCAVQHLQLES